MVQMTGGWLRRLGSDDGGASAVEYAVLLALIIAVPLPRPLTGAGVSRSYGRDAPSPSREDSLLPQHETFLPDVTAHV